MEDHLANNQDQDQDHDHEQAPAMMLANTNVPTRLQELFNARDWAGFTVRLRTEEGRAEAAVRDPQRGTLLIHRRELYRMYSRRTDEGFVPLQVLQELITAYPEGLEEPKMIIATDQQMEHEMSKWLPVGMWPIHIAIREGVAFSRIQSMLQANSNVSRLEGGGPRRNGERGIALFWAILNTNSVYDDYHDETREAAEQAQLAIRQALPSAGAGDLPLNIYDLLIQAFPESLEQDHVIGWRGRTYRQCTALELACGAHGAQVNETALHCILRYAPEMASQALHLLCEFGAKPLDRPFQLIPAPAIGGAQVPPPPPPQDIDMDALEARAVLTQAKLSRMLSALLNAYPEATVTPDSQGRLPYALARDMNGNHSQVFLETLLIANTDAAGPDVQDLPPPDEEEAVAHGPFYIM